jgi:hypothetical protein
MSAKGRNKMKNNETPAAVPAVEPPAPEAPAAASSPGAPPVVEATATELPAKPTLLLRARLATGKAVVTIFSRVRTAQATAVQKSLALISAADAGLSKSLLVGEQFVLTRLRVTPE